MSYSAPPAGERWPVVYDLDSLQDEIKNIVSGPHSEYYGYYTSPTTAHPVVCQGDIVSLDTKVPLISKDGVAVARKRNSDLWLVLSNTCDLTREAVDHSILCPVENFESMQTSVKGAQGFKTSRLYHVRPWDTHVPETLVADLTQTVCAHKSALVNKASVKARLSWHAWLLLHCCLVRFFARDDGRAEA